MSEVRAEILPYESPWVRSARIEIAAPAQAVFDIVADPRRHAEIDGSGSVVGNVRGPQRLSLGAKFGVDMKIKLPYRVVNTVVEFADGRLIAWRHFHGHRWRYELEETDHGTTVVTETFDARGSLAPKVLDWMGAYRKNEVAIAKTLVRLKAVAEAEQASASED